MINSIPFGAFFRTRNFFVGGLVAYQSVATEESNLSISAPIILDVVAAPQIEKDISNNAYIFRLVGTRLPGSKVSVAASVTWADYQAIDGVTLLYPESYDIRQSGGSRSLKVGIVSDLTDEDQLGFLVERGLFKAMHDVTYSSQQQRDQIPTAFRTETNRDESKQWALHGSSKRELGGGWKVGSILTVNWKDYPKSPNYALASIPRDPGTTVAYNVGLGMVKKTARSTWGLESIYEPITSNTWAEAGEATPTPGIPTLSPNFKTVEAFPDFHNHILRVGIHWMTDHQWLEFRLGAQVRFYKYNLGQINNMSRTSGLFG